MTPFHAATGAAGGAAVKRPFRLDVPKGLAVLTVPGLHGSGPAHWQSRWEARFAGWRRVEQRDWSRPSLHLWADRVHEFVAQSRQNAPRGAVLVAHSFGCLATVRQAALDPEGIAAALLVAPADPDRFGVGSLLPTWRLPFPTMLVASRNDPWMAQRTAFSWGALWGSEPIDVGSLGHVNADSGLGDWPDGVAALGALLQRLDARDRRGIPGSAPTPWESGLEGPFSAPYI